MTISATQNIHPLPAMPHVINAQGTKYRAIIRAVLRCRRQSPLRLKLCSLKYASTRARRVLVKSDVSRL